MTKESYWIEWESRFDHDCNFSSLVHGQMANFRQTFRLWEEPKNLRGHFFTCTTLHWSGELYHPHYSKILIFVQKFDFWKNVELYFFIRITDESEIPQGTLVFPNLSWIMHDENHFKTPETFDPQRFLHQELLKKNFVFSAWWTSDSIFYRETRLFRTEDHIVWKFLKMSHF